SRVIAIHRATRSIDEPFNSCFLCRLQDFYESSNVTLICRSRIGERTRDRTERGLMQNIVHTRTCSVTRFGIANVLLDHLELFPLGGTYLLLDVIEVGLPAGHEVIQTHHPLSPNQQRFK